MTITTILNCYRRPKNLADQIKAIRQQTLPSSEIWVWCNYHEDNKDFIIEGVDKIIHSSFNFKFHGRFTVGLLARTDYLAYFDDDTIPGNRWFETCMKTEQLVMDKYKTHPVIGSAGIRLLSKNYINHQRVGWPSKNKDIELVDLVGHAWFFNKKILQSFWGEEPLSLDNCEDLQLSFFAQKNLGSITVCPPHPEDHKEMWGSLRAEELGIDAVASSNNIAMSHDKFFSERNEVIKKAIDKGWKTLYNV